MKLVSLFVASFFIVNSSFANIDPGMEAAFNDYVYNISVVWDQESQTEKEVFVNEFIDQAQELGYELDEVASYLVDHKLDEKERAEFEPYFSNYLTREQKIAYLDDLTAKSTTQGASWSASGAALILTGVLASVFTILLIREGDTCDYNDRGICD